MKIFISIFLFGLLLSCSKSKDHALLSPENLESWYITVDENTDSVFKTPKGGLIKIRKGTFEKEIDLEIKEAYTMRDILLGGLTTTSDGRPLSSAGMIYINSKDKEQVNVLKPITVATPTNFVNEEMELYKGEELNDTINWTKPDTLPATALSIQIENGRQLFQQLCATCHGINRDGTGPALRGFRNRGNWKDIREVYKWVRNPPAYIVRDSYTRELREKFGTIMISFPALSDSSISAIAAYIQNEEGSPYDEIALAETTDTSGKNMEPPCIDTLFYNEPDTSSWDPIPLEPALLEESEDSEIKYDPPSSYTFDIYMLGWYNLDVLIGKLRGSTPTDITVNVDLELPGSVVFLLLPEHKTLVSGVKDSSGGYRFDKTYGPIPFISGAKALIVSYGIKGEDFFFGFRSFSMKEEQTISIKMTKGTEKQFLDLMKGNKVEIPGIAMPEQDTLEMEIETIDLDRRRPQMKRRIAPCEPTLDTTRLVNTGRLQRERVEADISMDY